MLDHKNCLQTKEGGGGFDHTQNNATADYKILKFLIIEKKNKTKKHTKGISFERKAMPFFGKY